jgi:hypothetical protein
MTEEQSTPTTYAIEALRPIIPLGDDVEKQKWAWLPVGEIVADPDAEYFYYRDALVAWAGEQDGEPPVGRYRVIEHSAHGWSNFNEFEIREHRETVIERYAPAEVRPGVPADTAAAIEVIADAAAAPGME